MADDTRCADCGAVAPLFPFYGAWVRDGRPQRSGLLCRACIERLSPPIREDYAERVGSLTRNLGRWQRALTAWSVKQPARETAYEVRRLEASEPAKPPARPVGRPRGPTSKPLSTEQRDLVTRAQRYRSLHQAAPALGIPYTTLRGWALRYKREDSSG